MNSLECVCVCVCDVDLMHDGIRGNARGVCPCAVGGVGSSWAAKLLGQGTDPLGVLLGQ